MNTTISPEARAYLEAVRSRLQGVPSDEADELVADLEQHISELMAEEPGPLSDRLGPPEEYAAELTATAGWSDYRPKRNVSIASLLSGWKQRLSSSPGLRWWTRYWPDYRPGWWVMRVFIGAAVWGAIQWAVPSIATWFWSIPIAVASVLVGRRATRGAGWLVADRLATFVGLWAILVALANGVTVMSQLSANRYLDYNPMGLVGPNGFIENIYAFDRDGDQVEVFLYDQNGSPIVANWNQYTTIVDVNGQPVDNFYPSKRLIDGQAQPALHVQVPELAGD